MEIMDTAELQTQLISILETLAKTAIVETLKLFQKNSFLLRLEISRCTNENESLKKKCHFLESELQSARKTVGKMNGTEASFSHPGLSESGRRPTIDNVFGKEWCMNLWRHGESGVGEQEDDTHLDSSAIPEEPVNLLDDEPDVIMIKEETLKIEDCSGKDKPEAKSSSWRGPAMTSDERCVAQSSEDFLTHTIPSDDHVKLRRRLSKDKNILDGTTAMHGNGVTGSDLSPDVGFFPSKVEGKCKQVTNTQKKKLKCVLCEKTFEFLSRLQKHMRTHSGEKPFVCTVCGRRFAQKPNFLLHERTHSGERPYGYT